MTTGLEFISHVKVKLNRIDTNAYEDIRPEEVLFFGFNALKSLILGFDLGSYSAFTDKLAMDIYLASLIKHQPELPLVSGEALILSSVLKYKDVQTLVTIGTENGWVPASRDVNNNKTSNREDNPFRRSFPDNPTYRLIDGNIKFDSIDFTCSKYKYDYLVQPEEIEEDTELTFPFIEELEDKTVTLILENIENKRLETQPMVSRS